MALRKALIAVTAMWLAAFASSLTAVAQEGDSIAIEIASIDQSAPPSVSAVVNVLDAAGRPIGGLDVASFQATVDGQPATVEGLQTVVDSQVSLSVVLAVDASGSMAGEPLAAARAAAAEFVNGLSPQDSVAVLAFSDLVAVAQEPTADKASAIKALQGLAAAGNTALFEATSRATAKALDSSTPRRVIILLSDGVDYGGKSTVTRDDSIAQARAAGVPLYTIGLGADVDRAYLNELAQATRARFLEAPTPAGLSQLYGDIAAVLRGQYVVRVNLPEAQPGSSHLLELSVTVGGATAVASETVAISGSGQSLPVAVTGLSSGQKVKSAVIVTAQVSGGAPTEVRFLIDGQAVTTATTPPYQASLDPAGLGDGSHTLRIEARDAAGVLGSQDIGFVVAPAATGGSRKMLLFAGLLAVVVGLGGGYLLRRRRPRVKRQVVEVRLKPWSNNGAVAGSLSLLEDGPLRAPEPEPREEPGGKLVMVNGPDAGKEYLIGTNPLSIGSATWCDIKVADNDGEVGPEEARVWVHQDKLIFHRLTRLSLLASDGATGGWLILEEGDEVNVGPVRLCFISLALARTQQTTLNEAVNEAVQQFATRSTSPGIMSVPSPSRLWPAADVPAEPSDEGGQSAQLASLGLSPLEDPSEEEESSAQTASTALWPVDVPFAEPSQEADGAQPSARRLYPVDDSYGGVRPQEEDVDPPAAASSA